MRAFKRQATLCCCLLLLFGAAVQGAEPPERTNLGDLVVTAQKQSEQAQDVPISLTLFDSFDLEDREIDSIRDISTYTPSLMLFDIGFSTSSPPSIRGLFADALTLESTMGIYVDGIPVTMGVGINDPLLDVERVEVLKGPQGTLYGKNTEAGVLNVITKPLTNETVKKVSLQGGSDNLIEASASIGGALIKDKLYLGFSARHYEKDGYVKNTITGKTVDDRKNDYGKVNLRFTPTDALDIQLVKSILKYDDDAGSLGSTMMPDRQVSSGLDGKNTSQNDLTSMKIHYDISPDFSIDSVTTHRIFDDEKVQDYDFTPNEILHVFADSQYTKTSQEVRFNAATGKVNWLIGLYGDTFDNDMNEKYTGMMPRTILQTIDGNSLGIFTHANYAATSKLNLIAGVRYDDEKKSLKDDILSLDLENDYSEVSPKVAVNYKITSNVMGYATVAKGYRAGGFNPYSVPGYPKTYDEETLISYDLGVKSQLFNKALTLNANIYYMDISDMQVTANTSQDNSALTYTSNAAEATSKGAEVEFRAMLFKYICLFGGVGINDTTYDTFKDAVGDYSGNDSKFAPKYSYNCGIAYRDPRGIFAQIDTTGYGKMYLDKANEKPRDAFQLVNAKIGYEGSFYDVYLYGRNIFDEEYDSLGFADLYDTYSPPAEYGARVNLRF